MDGLISDEFFTIPVVLENQNVGQAVNTMGYKGLQVVMAKDQPLLILDAGNLNFQNVPDPLMLSNTNNSFINTIDLPISREDIEHTLDDTEIEQVATRDKVNDDELNLDITPNEDLMDELIETLVIYKCKLCPFKTSEKNCLSKHLVSEHGANLKNDLNQDTLLKTVTGKDTEAGCSAREEQMVYMCANCTEAFVTYADCRIHMALVHKIMIGNVKSEDVKAELFNTNFNLNQVIKDPSVRTNIKVVPSKKNQTPKGHEKKLKYVCPISGCQVKLSSREFLDKHKLCHIADSQEFTCTECSSTFSKWIRCAHHLWKSHNIDVDLYSCQKCSYKTPNKIKLNEHCMIHNESKNFTCNVCGKNFKQGAQLRNHEVLHLKGGKDEDKLPNWTRRRECDQCGKTFCDSKALKKHVKAVHAKLKPYSCQVCGHCSATKNMLRVHLRQHSGDKPFACPACSYSTGDHNSLRRHWMRHTGVRPYSCPHCPYSAIQSCSLKSHLLRQHPGLPGIYSCYQCSFVSVSKNSLDDHLRTHNTNESSAAHHYRMSNTGTFNNNNNNNNNNAVNNSTPADEDDESNHFFENESIVNDTGGITIPAD